MPDPTSDDLIPLDRWSVPLDEPASPLAPVPPPASDDGPTPDLLRFPLDADAPPEGFHPRLTRFGRTG